MKKRNIVSVFILVFIILGLFAACPAPTQPDSIQLGSTQPGSTSSYTVTFNANGGNPVPNKQSIAPGGKVVMPTMTRTNYIFGGWYKETACINQWNFAIDRVRENTILYAQWYSPITVPGNTLAAKLQWLSTNATSNKGYLIEVTSSEELASQNLSYNYNITVQLKGISTSSTSSLSLLGTGSLFRIGDGVTLILEGNLTLSGKNNNSPLIQVSFPNTLIMNQGVKITNNNSDGVNVGGTFAMNGGEISGNYKGVNVDYGTFTMNGGEISGNYKGVYVDYGTFTMNNGKISGNSSGDDGGGVCVTRNGTFTMNNGEISGNSSRGLGVGGISGMGGGVYVNGTFTMNNGKISGNTSSGPDGMGGGVYVTGTFTMNDGVISGNTSSGMGGGVYVTGTFTKSGGTITGYASDMTNGNVVKNNGVVQTSNGHAVYGYGYDGYGYSQGKRKETTARPTDNLSMSHVGQWSYIFAGAWDY